jgi:hypothetical protein
VWLDREKSTLVAGAPFTNEKQLFGVWVFGESNAVNLKVPSNPPKSLPNHDTTGATTDIYAIKFNETDGDPFISMFLGGDKNEAIFPNLPMMPTGIDFYAYIYMESTKGYFTNQERIRSLDFFTLTRVNKRDTFIMRWRGRRIYTDYTGKTAPTTSSMVQLTGTDIWYTIDYVTQMLFVGNTGFENGFAPDCYYIEPETQDPLYGMEFTQKSSQFTTQTQTAFTNSDTSAKTQDVVLYRALSNGAYSALMLLQGNRDEYLTQVLTVRSNTKFGAYAQYAIGTYTSDQLSFKATASSVTVTAGKNLINTKGGKHDVYVISFGPGGVDYTSPIWAFSIGGVEDDFVDKMMESIDMGTLIVYGRFKSPTISMNSTSYSKSSGSSLDSEDIFILSIAPKTGVFNWGAVFGGTTNEKIVNVTEVTTSTGLHNGIIVSGYFSSPTMTVGSIVLTNNGTGSTNDIFAIKYNKLGNVQWAVSFGGSGDDHLLSVANVTAVGGGVVLIGTFSQSVYTVGEYTLNNTNANSNSAFMVYVMDNGEFGWVKQLDGSFDSNVSFVIGTHLSGFTVSGQFSDHVKVTPYQETIAYDSAGDTDVFSATFIMKCLINGVACGGHGKCDTTTQICTCDKDYVRVGVLCNARQCYGVNFNDTKVCSSNGICKTDGTCICGAGYTGNNCQNTFECYGYSSINSTVVCNGHGTCVGQDVCKCTSGWIGQQCNKKDFVCYDKNGSDVQVCSGRGICVGYDSFSLFLVYV